MNIASISKQVASINEELSNSSLDAFSQHGDNLIELQSAVEQLNNLVFKDHLNVLNPDDKLEAILDSITEIGRFNFDNGPKGDSINVVDDLDFIDQAVRMLKNSLAEKLEDIVSIANATFTLDDCFILTDKSGHIKSSFGSQNIISTEVLIQFKNKPVNDLFNLDNVKKNFSIDFIDAFPKHHIHKGLIDNIEAESVIQISINPTADGYVYKISQFNKDSYQ